MLEHLKRILSKLTETLTEFIDRHKQSVVWNTIATLGIDASDNSGYVSTGNYDELTIMHVSNQGGYLRIFYKCPLDTVYQVDQIDYGSYEVVSRVYAITGVQVMVQCTNIGAAQLSRSTYCALRKS